MTSINYPIVTIVISTFNRVSLLQENINKILDNKSKDFCVIIGDNASTDKTWEMLKTISDGRVSYKRNQNNLGIANVMLLDYDVKTKYFINLNDRDYIKTEDLDKLCQFLYHVETFEMCSLYPHKGTKVGKCSATNFINEYYLANHPGYLVYNTEFYKKNINKTTLDNFFEKNDMINLSNYGYIQLLYNLRIGYYYPLQIVQQPENRDKNLPQTRKELYGVAYVLPEYHMGAIKSLIDYVTNANYDDKKIICNLIIGTFDFAMSKIGQEYFFATIDSNFRKRNHIENASPWKCFHNIISLTRYVINIEELSTYYKIRKILKLKGIKTIIFLILRMIKHSKRTIKAIFYKTICS